MAISLELRTISQSLNSHIKSSPASIRLFNFSDGVKKIDLTKDGKKEMMGAYETTWIRVYDLNNQYYDFITSNLFFVVNKEGVLLLCSEDTELISAVYIADLVKKYADQSKEGSMFKTADDLVENYYKSVSKEISDVNQRLLELYSSTAQSKIGRLEIEDSFEYGKARLAKKYLLEIISRKIIKENKNEIASFL